MKGGNIMIRPPITKGKLGAIKFQLNPTNISISGGGAVWTELTAPTMKHPINVYASGSSKKFSFDLYLNKRTSNYDVEGALNAFNNYYQGKEPVLFTYTHGTCKVIITNMSVSYDTLDRYLKPIEATVSFELTEYTN